MPENPPKKQPPEAVITPFLTEDGSLSCFNAESREAYHNKAGAYTEALENFIRPSGVLERAATQQVLRVLDPCFGLGYNTWVLMDEVLKLSTPPARIEITAIEKDPDILPIALQALDCPVFTPLRRKIRALEHNTYYRTQLSTPPKSGRFDPIPLTGLTESGRDTEIVFSLWVDDLRGCIKDIQGPCDIILHDAFSAQRMPELWTVDLFREYYRLANPVQGRVITYSSAAAVRGGLLEAGFQLLKTRPLGEKNGGTLAYLGAFSGEKPPGCEALNKTEEYYLETRAGIPYRDHDLNQLRQTITESRKREQYQSGRPSGAETRASLLQK